MALREDLLPVFQDARQLIQDLGLRTHRTIRRIVTWSGTEVGYGTTTPTDTEILPRPKVVEIAEGYEISKITPEFSGGGYNMSFLNPAIAANQELYWVVVDPIGNERLCLYDAGTLALNTGRNFGYSLRVLHVDRRRPL